MTVYRKWGRTVRWENGTIVRVDEAGQAIEEGGEFRAQPLGERRALDDVDVPHCDLPAAERVVMTNGVAVHEFGGVTWTERVQRVHVSIARAPYRLLLDELPDVALLALFDRIDGRREAPPRLTLAPRVTASILYSPIGRVELAQRAGDTPDGYGRAVESCAVTAGEPPNWYRPSYRVRPVRAWFNLFALPFGRLDDGAPRAVALLDGGDVLCVAGDDVFAAPLRVGRILAVGGSTAWFPYAAGAWGADMLLESGA